MITALLQHTGHGKPQTIEIAELIRGSTATFVFVPIRTVVVYSKHGHRNYNKRAQSAEPNATVKWAHELQQIMVFL